MDHITQQFQTALQTSSGLAFAFVYLGGVLTSFTPCVYPMIPITVGFMGGQVGSSRLRTVTLVALYVLGIAVTYSALGAAAALTGATFGTFANNPWVYIGVAAVIALFGLAMMDLVHLPLPRFLTTGSGQARRGYLGAVVMGLAAGLVAAPCTAPVLGAVLVYVASQQNVPLGVALLFVFALGLGTLLMIVGLFTGLVTNLPASGPWLEKAKKGFGGAMVAVAAWIAYGGYQRF
ncbi:MAG TPA: cytochrome c biogenesis protein CcdA [bacterium]|jgi:thiol:disulfide interchange protein DsbD